MGRTMGWLSSYGISHGTSHGLVIVRWESLFFTHGTFYGLNIGLWEILCGTYNGFNIVLRMKFLYILPMGRPMGSISSWDAINSVPMRQCHGTSHGFNIVPWDSSSRDPWDGIAHPCDDTMGRYCIYGTIPWDVPYVQYHPMGLHWKYLWHNSRDDIIVVGPPMGLPATLEIFDVP